MFSTYCNVPRLMLSTLHILISLPLCDSSTRQAGQKLSLSCQCHTAAECRSPILLPGLIFLESPCVTGQRLKQTHFLLLIARKSMFKKQMFVEKERCFFRKVLIQETRNLGRWWTSIPKIISELLVKEKRVLQGKLGSLRNVQVGTLCRTAHLAPIIILELVGPCSG